MNWIKRAWARLSGRSKTAATADIFVPLTDGRTTEDAITIAVAAITAGLEHCGGDIRAGNVQHHTHHDEDLGIDVHHAVWVRGAVPAE